MRRAAIEGDALDAAMRAGIDFAARRFVHAARLHADEAVLDEVAAADSMLAAEVVERREQRSGPHSLAGQRDPVADSGRAPCTERVCRNGRIRGNAVEQKKT